MTIVLQKAQASCILRWTIMANEIFFKLVRLFFKIFSSLFFCLIYFTPLRKVLGPKLEFGLGMGTFSSLLFLCFVSPLEVGPLTMFLLSLLDWCFSLIKELLISFTYCKGRLRRVCLGLEFYWVYLPSF